MGATVLNSQLVGVSLNSFHMEDGSLMVADQELNRKLEKYKVENSVIPIQKMGNLHKAFISMFGEIPLGVYPSTGNEFLVTGVIEHRSIKKIALIFPENIVLESDGSFTNGFTDFDSNVNFKNLLSLVKTKIFGETSQFFDYSPLHKDEYLYDFFGEMVLDEELGNSFVVERIGVTDVINPNICNDVVSGVSSISGSPVEVTQGQIYFDFGNLTELSLSHPDLVDGELEITGNLYNSNPDQYYVVVDYWWIAQNYGGYDGKQTFDPDNYNMGSDASNNIVDFYLDLSDKVAGDKTIFILMSEDDFLNDDFSNLLFEVQMDIVS